MNDTDLVEMFTVTDPLRADTSTAGTDGHLLTARRVLDARRSGVGPVPVPARSRRRRLVVVAALATALPVAATVLAPAVSSRLGTNVPLAGTAIAGEGGLTCGEGYAAAIRPDAANPRPWPQQLPAGWAVREVFARAYTGTGWCTTPSLNAAEVDPSGTVTGSVKITGPARGIEVGDGGPEPTEDRIGPYAARRLAPYGGAPVPVDAVPDQFTKWIITDGDGAEWYATVQGYTAEQGRKLLSAATLQGGLVAWDTARAPQLQVLHLRTGAPYPTRTTQGQDWYLRLDAGGRTLGLEATSGRAGDSAMSRAGSGSRIVTIAGQSGFVVEDGDRPVAVVADLAGATVSAEVIDGDLQPVLDLMASVTSLDADDPRLDELALKEDYERP